MFATAFKFIGALSLCVLFTGCGAETKQSFADRVRQACTRSESRVSPKTMELAALQEICGRQPKVSDVDEHSRNWRFDFPDGAVELPVLADAGSDWNQPNPRVFVLVTQIKVR
jgi:hypothetical protein